MRISPALALSAASSLALSAVLMSGCSSALIPTPTPAAAIPVGGNWQFNSAASASPLPALSGELAGTSTAIQGVLHSRSDLACVSPGTPIAVTGSTNRTRDLILAGPLAGGTLTITGTLAEDGKSLSDAAYVVKGGSCALPKAAISMAQAYSPITGHYAGTFADASGPVLSVAADLSQSPAADSSGNFQLSGTATFPANGCFNSPVTVSNSQVTGGSFDLTYADSSTGNSVRALGNFSADGTTLTVTSWTLTGSCGPDSGTGSLQR